MAKAKDGGDRRRLLYCKNCDNMFYTYKLTRTVDCPTCHKPVSKTTTDENIEDGTLIPNGGEKPRASCMGPIITFVLVLASAYAVWFFRESIKTLIEPVHIPNAPTLESNEPAPANSDVPADTGD